MTLDPVLLSSLAALAALAVVVWLAVPPRYRAPALGVLGGLAGLALVVLQGRRRPPSREPDLTPITDVLAAGEQEAARRSVAEHRAEVAEIEDRATLSDADRHAIADAEWQRRRKRPQ